LVGCQVESAENETETEKQEQSNERVMHTHTHAHMYVCSVGRVGGQWGVGEQDRQLQSSAKAANKNNKTET